MLLIRTTLAVAILTLFLTACNDIYRDPCGYVRTEATTTTVRTKNKALGAGAVSGTYFPELAPRVSGQRGSKCA
jgi:hypothetical protein